MTEQPATGVIPEFTIGDRLRKARELTGLDRAEFAGELGISRNTVNNYEAGHTRPRLLALRAWAMRTGVPLTWLQTGAAPRRGRPDEGLNSDAKRARRDSNPQPSDPKVGPAGVDELTARRVDRERRLRRERRRTIVPATAFAAAS